MAIRRTKSINDIIRQDLRISRILSSRIANDPSQVGRYARLSNRSVQAASRYMHNIESSPAFRDNKERVSALSQTGRQKEVGRLYDQMYARQFPRQVYMGLVNK